MINWILTAVVILAVISYICLHRAKRAVLVFCYEKTGHAPGKSCLSYEWTSATRLEKTLKTLIRHKFTTVFPADLTRQKLPSKPVLLAFMGGYQSFYTDVFPLLQKYKTKACVFLAQDFVGTYNAWQNPHEEPWQNLLTPAQLKEMDKSGLVSFGAIELRARDLTLLPETEARFGLKENIFRLKEQLGLTAQAAAFWPASKWNKKTAQGIMRGLEKLPVLTPVQGVNPEMKTTLLKTLRGNSLRARRALWFRR